MDETKKSLGTDMQQQTPKTAISLSRVGITNLRRMIRLNANGRETLFYAEMDLFAHLDALRAGVHMSRFVENIEQIAVNMVTESTPTIESLATRMAETIAQSQQSDWAEVHIRAQFPERKYTPVSNLEVENIYTFVGMAASNGEKSRHIVGVEVNGFTVCPCAREMVAEHSRSLLEKEGYCEEEASRIVSLLPLASHNQRGRGTLLLGTDKELSAERLVRLAEASMSCDIFELLKRPDELYVVEKGHRTPRFVEDVSRQMVHNVLNDLADLGDDDFILARQVNFESIHEHNAYAERYGLIGEIRSELAGQSQPSPHVTLEGWLARPL